MEMNLRTYANKKLISPKNKKWRGAYDLPEKMIMNFKE